VQKGNRPLSKILLARSLWAAEATEQHVAFKERDEPLRSYMVNNKMVETHFCASHPASAMVCETNNEPLSKRVLARNSMSC